MLASGGDAGASPIGLEGVFAVIDSDAINADGVGGFVVAFEKLGAIGQEIFEAELGAAIRIGSDRPIRQEVSFANARGEPAVLSVPGGDATGAINDAQSGTAVLRVFAVEQPAGDPKFLADDAVDFGVAGRGTELLLHPGHELGARSGQAARGRIGGGVIGIHGALPGPKVVHNRSDGFFLGLQFGPAGEAIFQDVEFGLQQSEARGGVGGVSAARFSLFFGEGIDFGSGFLDFVFGGKDVALEGEGGGFEFKIFKAKRVKILAGEQITRLAVTRRRGGLLGHLGGGWKREIGLEIAGARLAFEVANDFPAEHPGLGGSKVIKAVKTRAEQHSDGDKEPFTRGARGSGSGGGIGNCLHWG